MIGTLLLLTVFEMDTMVLPQGIGHPLVGRHSHLAHLWVSDKDWREGRVHIMDMEIFLDMMTMELEMAHGTFVAENEARRNSSTPSRR